MVFMRTVSVRECQEEDEHERSLGLGGATVGLRPKGKRMKEGGKKIRAGLACLDWPAQLGSVAFFFFSFSFSVLVI